MSSIKWVRLSPPDVSMRPDFHNLFAKHNDIQLCLTLTYSSYDPGTDKDHLDLRWSVSRKDSKGFEVLGAGSYQILPVNITKRELRKVVDLFKRRAEGIARGWIEE